jgi:hypothetical protein
VQSQVGRPEPGTEYPFSISDIAHATARVLGGGWVAKPGAWGVTGRLELKGVDFTAFNISVDEDDFLQIEYDRYVGDGFPEIPELPDGVHPCACGVFFDYAATSGKGLDELAEQFAAAVRAVTGDCAPDVGMPSSASCQDRRGGRELRQGEAEQG